MPVRKDEQQNYFTMTDTKEDKSNPANEKNSSEDKLAEYAAKIVEIVNSGASKEERQAAIWEILNK